ncbi:hypothetical protein RHGRI_002349 [Rhododendron griersonianum]|uniref:DEUBAD domain-containing protein n=1 Tax=Rhododendron griersonianum TaxID=479676 RepID=A0AAV6LPY5_9ERIC|nr:hypothetical protein RHGRI_002349 [Rhododendron griersonianum]
MGRIASPLLLQVVALCCAVAMVKGYDHHEGGEGGERRGRERMFMLRHMKRVVRTDAGEMKVVRGSHGWISDMPNIHVGFVTMKPNSLFIPQYLDSDLILFIRRGEARVGSIYKDELIEKRLNCGDVYRIPAGSTFYLVNIVDGQQLHVICSIEKSDSIGWGTFQDVLNFNQFSSNLTIEEQQQLLKYLPSVDTARLPDSLKSMFASPKFKENISSFQKLHGEGVFNLSLSEDRKCSSINEGSVVQGGPNAIANGNSTNVKRMRGQLQNSPGPF